MDRGKKLTNFYGNKNCKIYMDLKDVIRENALPYLPAKSLFRCTGVCRDWKLQISTPLFAHNQTNSFRSTSGFFYQTQAGMPSFLSLDPMAYGVPDPSLSFLPEPVDIRTSCNGLLCCQGRSGYLAYYICNPVTKHWKKLPKPDADHGPDPAVVLVFEPSLLNFFADYKLVCAFPSELGGYEFEIYSSEKGSWRTSGEICFADRKLLPKTGVHVNGIVYWLSRQGITAFDLNSERSQLLSSAPGALGMTNGKLCAVHVRGQGLVVNMLSNTHSNTMQMCSNARTWVEMRPENNLDIPLPAESSNYSGRHGHGHGHGGVVFVGGDVVLLQNGNIFCSYDMKKKASNYLGEINIDTNAAIVGYVNSLVEL
ncbi:F-box protein At5g49610-like isoform X2 [Durio zibethinus]|nr:F-box protein At5g49610-like isoform X2 [Durio zibethinus]XP_022741414.1 F-box protein At5g49610-like isoform X2 [Durio zibethinus]